MIRNGFNGYEFFLDLATDREMEYLNFMQPYGQYPGQAMSPSTDLAMDMGTDPTKVQVMRASFFNTIDDDADEYESKSGKNREENILQYPNSRFKMNEK